MHCNNLRLVLRLGLARVSSRVRVRIRVKVKVRVSVMVRVSISTSWVALLPASNLHSSQTLNDSLTTYLKTKSYDHVLVDL